MVDYSLCVSIFSKHIFIFAYFDGILDCMQSEEYIGSYMNLWRVFYFINKYILWLNHKIVYTYHNL